MTAPASTSCTHCGEPVPSDRLTTATSAPRGAEKPVFCCVGCEAVYHALHESGFDAFYHYSEVAIGDGGPVAEVMPTVLPAEVLRAHATACEGGDLESTLDIDGIHCAGCVWLIEQMPRIIHGVHEARLDVSRGRLSVRWNPETLDEPSEIFSWLARFGYDAKPLDGSKLASYDSAEAASLRRVGISWALAGNVMLLSAAHYAGLDAEAAPMMAAASRWLMLMLTSISLFYGASVILRRAWSGVGSKVLALASGERGSPLPVDVPLALGMLIGWGASAWATVTGQGALWLDSVAMLIAAILTARWVQQRAGRAARQKAEQLLAMLPHTARRLTEEGSIEQVPVDALRPGDLVEVRSGEVVPADGEVVRGEAALERGILTGESRLEPIAEGGAVEAGVTAASGALVVRVRAAGDETRVGRLMAWIDERSGDRAALVQRADRLGGWFVAAVVAAATLAGILWSGAGTSQALEVMVAVLVISCPCALGMATPLALAIATGFAASRGIFIKHDDTLESCAQADVVIFDKTGTLTSGRPEVTVRAGCAQAMGWASALEANSAHPIARALAASDSFSSRDVTIHEDRAGFGVRGTVEGREVIAGRPDWVLASVGGAGASAEVAEALDDVTDRGITAVLVAIDGRVEALFGLEDTLRPEARDLIEQVRARGAAPMILSGDHASAVANVATALGIPAEDARAGMTPEDKIAAIERLHEQGHTVVMVGDGVNDAAALQRADVGVAVSGGAHVSLAAADVFLTEEGLGGVMRLFRGADEVMRVVNRNIAYALGYNIIGVGLAIAGVVTPLVAAVLMPLSSLLLLWMTATQRSFREEAATAAATPSVPTWIPAEEAHT